MDKEISTKSQMGALLRLFTPSIGRKVVMALTGLFLVVFLCEHLYGNLEMYKNDGGVSFEWYTNLLTHNLIIRTIEYVFFGAIFLHAIYALLITLKNRKARPIRYEMSKQSGNSTWFSRNMGLTGSVILFFLVVHLRTFFFEHRFLTPTEDMYHSVITAFHQWWYAALYLVSVVFLGFHLNHGFQSAFQTLGLNNKFYAPVIKACGTAFAIIMTIGYASFPIVFYFEILK